jgi:hypothetical protein
VWQHILETLQQQVDASGALDWDKHYIDSTIVRAHQHAAGAKGGDPEAEALGRSQGGSGTKVHLRAEGSGKPVTFAVITGQRHEAVAFERLMEQGAVKRSGQGQPKLRPVQVVGDKGYCSRKIWWYLRRRGIRMTIPGKASEGRKGQFDSQVYRGRNRVERLINRLKQFRRVATRYEKRTATYLAMLTIAAILLWL